MSDLHFEQCNGALESLTSLLENTSVSEIQLSQLKKRFPDCIKEIEDQYKIWNDLIKVETPNPSYKMHSRFYKSLSKLEETEGTAAGSTGMHVSESSTKVIKLWHRPWQYAIAVSILAIGILIGKSFNIHPSNNNNFITSNDSPISRLMYVDQKQAITATDKLMAMQEIRSNAKPDEKIIEALYQALLNDPNINVRLTAIETLLHFADRPKAREYLIKAIPSQESALVQVALADAMLLLEEKQSAAAWNELLNSPNIEPDVRIDITERLETLL